MRVALHYSHGNIPIYIEVESEVLTPNNISNILSVILEPLESRLETLPRERGSFSFQLNPRVGPGVEPAASGNPSHTCGLTHLGSPGPLENSLYGSRLQPWESQPINQTERVYAVFTDDPSGSAGLSGPMRLEADCGGSHNGV